MSSRPGGEPRETVSDGTGFGTEVAGTSANGAGPGAAAGGSWAGSFGKRTMGTGGRPVSRVTAALVLTGAGGSCAVSERADAKLDIETGEEGDTTNDAIAAMANAPRMIALRTEGFIDYRVG